MFEFTKNRPEHFIKGECFYAEKYPKGKATAHWAILDQHILKTMQITNIIIILSKYQNIKKALNIIPRSKDWYCNNFYLYKNYLNTFF